MKRLLVAAIVISIIATFVNDSGRYMATLFSLDSGTKEVARIAAKAVRSDRNKKQPGGKAAVEAAVERGFVLYGYEVEGDQVRVWTQAPVEGTWVAGPFLAWQAGTPLDTPPALTGEAMAFAR